MASYLQVTKDLTSRFDFIEITHIPREANSKVDRISQFSSSIEKYSTFSVVILLHSSIDGSSVNPLEEGVT